MDLALVWLHIRFIVFVVAVVVVCFNNFPVFVAVLIFQMCIHHIEHYFCERSQLFCPTNGSNDQSNCINNESHSGIH